MPTSYLQAVQCHDQAVNPIFTFLGARLTKAENGEAELTLPVSQQLSQSEGLIAGGILATMADEAMAHAVMSCMDNCNPLVTSEMNIRYLRSLRPGDANLMTAYAKVVKKGRSISVVESEVKDSNGRLLATAGATFCILPYK